MMELDNVDIRRLLNVSNISDETDIDEIKEKFEKFGAIEKVIKSGKKPFTVVFRTPPNFRVIASSIRSIDFEGSHPFVQPIKKRERELIVIPKKETGKNDIYKIFGGNDEVDWVFSTPKKMEYTILFNSPDSLEKWYQKRESFPDFEMKKFLDDNHERQARNITFNTIEARNIDPTTEEGEIKKFFKDFGKFTKYKEEKKLNEKIARCTFNDNESALKCLRNRTIKINHKVPKCMRMKTRIVSDTLKEKKVAGKLLDYFLQKYEENFDKLPENPSFEELCKLINDDFLELFNETMREEKQDYESLCNELFESVKDE